MSRALDPIEAAWVESFEESASELLKRGEFKLARVAGALADAIRKGEPIDIDTFREPALQSSPARKRLGTA